MAIRIIIADDERLAREELKYLLQQEKDVVLLPEATNGKELLKIAKEYQPDVIFLDMKMPEMEGMEAARILLQNENGPLIVCSTAHEDYAVEAFGMNAVDYLLKPTDPKRLKETMQRVRQRLGMGEDAEPKKEAHPSSAQKPAQGAKVSKLLIDDGTRFVVIAPESILYAVREERVIRIQTTQQVYTSRMTLQQLEEKLVAYPFFRPHRSYLVNLNYVHEITPWFNGAYNLRLSDEKRTQIPVSRSYAKELLNLLQGAG